MQVVTAVPTEKLETVAPYMDAISLVVRHGYHALIRDFRGTPKERVPKERAPHETAAAESGARRRARAVEEPQELDPTIGGVEDEA
jgi:hypothetical protein